MKGTLKKTEQGWVVEYKVDERTPIGHKSWWESLPLHPEHLEMMDTCFTSKFTKEVNFEIVQGNVDTGTLEAPYVKVNYAKLINHSVESNEMVCVFEPRTDTSSATICKYCGKEKFLHNQVSDVRKIEDDVEKLELDYYKELEERREVAKNFQGQVACRHPDMLTRSEMHHMVRGYLEGYNKAKETLYTEEQVRQSFRAGKDHQFSGDIRSKNEDEFIKSLKESKKD